MIYSDVYVKEPIEKIAEDWDFMSEKILPKFFGFRPVGDNVYGIRAITHDTQKTLGVKKDTPMDMAKNRRNYEIGPQGVCVVPRTPLTLHVTRSGTAHRTEFLFIRKPGIGMAKSTGFNIIGNCALFKNPKQDRFENSSSLHTFSSGLI